MTTLTHLSWPSAPETLVLSHDEVHVWRASLDLPAPQAHAVHRTLTFDELQRAERFRFQKDRDRYVAARGLLRAILGRYLNTEPARLRFSYGPSGKPYLADKIDGNDLSFNLSRRDDLALYAIARGREVGIDLERIRDDLEPGKIAGQFFSRREIAALQAAPEHTRRDRFFTYWACKEAFIKASGTGLSFPLDQFDIVSTTDKPEVSLSIEKEPEEAARWSLRTLPAGPGYAAGLAVEGHSFRLGCWQWRSYEKSDLLAW